MKQYVCTPIEGFHRFEVTVPGSKSITNRALLVGALAEGTTVLRGVLFSDDSKVFMQALRDIGFLVEVNEEEHKVVIEGHGGSIPAVSGAHEGRRVYVTLGQFSIIRLERDSQLLIPAYDYCMPSKECTAGGGEEDPCAIFRQVQFPAEEFFPANTITPPEGCQDKNCCL